MGQFSLSATKAPQHESVINGLGLMSLDGLYEGMYLIMDLAR